MIAVAVVMAAFLLLYALLLRSSVPERADAAGAAFDQVVAAETSGALKALLRLGRPFGATTWANLPEESPTYKALRLKLAASGGMYGGYVQVFLSTQIAALLVGSGALALVVAARPGGLLTVAGVVLGVAVIGWPYSKVWEAEKKRSAAINAALPEFAELLLMPLNSGYGILPALDFTARRLDSPVAAEVRHLHDAIRSRSRAEADAFADAGENLGTSAAKSFFAVLAQAYLEGVKVVDTINGQAVQLRKTEHERLRERIAKMENSIAVMTGIHLIPSLFLIILFPAIITMTGV